MKHVFLLATVLCCAAWVMAQSSNSQNSSASYNQSASASSQQESSQAGHANPNGDVRVTGCLRQANGEYQIKDVSTGTSYSLFGRHSDLSKYVGDDVEVMGMPTGTSGQTATPGSSGKNLGKNAGENPFQVHSVRELSQCSTSGK
ncbi:MAG TPA: hypothetical protein VMX38_12665 [Verrucomicrobiae bacterium]|jgi:hypothetical protein|nr:hypothetical protein [Verrucomicrobiae bacterium]